jgi:hypothetical protein
MKKTKRGQAALEFLMTYGWAILVVLVAIGALAYFGVLSPDRLVPEKCVIASGSGLFCDDYAATTDDITLRIKNILADEINITGITLNGTNFDCHVDMTGVGEAVVISADQFGNIAITVGDPGDDCTQALTAGDKLNVDITIDYQKSSSGLPKKATGQLVTTIA